MSALQYIAFRDELEKIATAGGGLTKEAVLPLLPVLAASLGIIPAGVGLVYGGARLGRGLARKMYGPIPEDKRPVYTTAKRGGYFPRDHSKYYEHLAKRDAARQKKYEAWRSKAEAAYTDKYEKVTGIQPSPKAKKPKKGGYWWSTK